MAIKSGETVTIVASTGESLSWAHVTFAASVAHGLSDKESARGEIYTGDDPYTETKVAIHCIATAYRERITSNILVSLTDSVISSDP